MELDERKISEEFSDFVIFFCDSTAPGFNIKLVHFAPVKIIYHQLDFFRKLFTSNKLKYYMYMNK